MPARLTLSALSALCALAASLLALPAGAAVPDPRFSTMDLVVVGSPLGVPIGGAPPGFDVLVRDVNNVPLAGRTVELGIGAAGLKLYTAQQPGTTVNCAAGTISRVTNAAGAVNFVPRFGGWNDAYAVEVKADGVPLGNVKARSLDYDKDGKVGIADFSAFSEDFLTQPATLRSDFDLSGVVGIGDFSIFSEQFPGPGTVQPTCP